MKIQTNLAERDSADDRQVFLAVLETALEICTTAFQPLFPLLEDLCYSGAFEAPVYCETHPFLGQLTMGRGPWGLTDHLQIN